MTLPNEIDISTTGLIENERVLVKDWSRFTFKLRIYRQECLWIEGQHAAFSCFSGSKSDESRVKKTSHFIT